MKAELGVHSPKINGDMRKLRWQYSVESMQRMGLPAMVDRAAQKKVTEGHAGMGWE